MELTNAKQVGEALRQGIGKRVGTALNGIISDIITEELPKGHTSSIADKLFLETVSDVEYNIVATSRVWSYLNDGTGIYGPHRGRGPGGTIVPLRAQALHFKNSEIASALGFADENVFLKKVKGIRPRFIWDRHITASKISEHMRKA